MRFDVSASSDKGLDRKNVGKDFGEFVFDARWDKVVTNVRLVRLDLDQDLN